jgi:hypothetical protein
VDQLADKAQKLELIAALRGVTAAHVHVEVERARVTRMLSRIQEDEGRIAEASETLQEVQVETFGSLDKREKADLILEQARLCMRQRDFVRMGIITNKLSKKSLDEAGLEDIKLRYYALMALLSHARHDAPALARGAVAVMETRGVKEDAARWRPALASACVYAALSPWDNAASDLMHRLKADTRLAEELPSHLALLTMLTTDEVVPWPLPEPHASVLRAHEAFSIDTNAIGAPGAAGSEIRPSGGPSAAASGMAVDDGAAPPSAAAAASAPSAAAAAASSSSSGLPSTASALRPAGALVSSIVLKEDEARAQWWEILRKRVVQHNLRVVAKAYSRCRFARLAQLLGLDGATTEAMVSELVSAGAIYARMDRPAGLVVFARPRPATEVLTEWASDLDQVLSLVDKATHLINKELLVHAAKPISAQ